MNEAEIVKSEIVSSENRRMYVEREFVRNHAKCVPKF